MGAGTSRLFYGWIVVACVSTVLLLTYGMQYSFGVLFSAMLHDLGWSRASLAGAFSLYSLVYIGLSFASGHLTDRLGPRRAVRSGSQERLTPLSSHGRYARYYISGEVLRRFYELLNEWEICLPEAIVYRQLTACTEGVMKQAQLPVSHAGATICSG